MPETSTRQFLRYWLPAILWLSLIASTSSDLFSAQHTGRILDLLLSALSIHMTWQHVYLLHFLIRKSAHFTEYLVMSYLWYRAGQSGRQEWRLSSVLLALGVCLLLASLDEWHQSFLPSRTGAFRDVVLDFSGALATQVVIAWRARRAARAQKRSAPEDGRA
ncbi:MAG TPA: VanZ family protein [Terriglobales bacterium]|nr:VanZ family protein [Terriglobales bacterium]